MPSRLRRFPVPGRRVLAMAIATAGAAAPAGAVLAPQYYEEMRADAPFLIVLDAGDVRFAALSNSRMYGTCTVSGTVAEIRRDVPGRLKRGERIEVRVPCMGDEPDEIMVGGTIWSELSALRRARRLELFLDADLSVAAQGDGIAILDPR